MKTVEITEKWNANVCDLNSTGTRSFLYMADGKYPNNPTTMDCPVIGSVFGLANDDIASVAAPWSTMYCRKIKTNILKQTINNKIITCFYNNEPWDRTGALGGISEYSSLPRESQIAGENQHIGEDNNGWKWKSDDVWTKQPLYKHIGITNFYLVKIIATPGNDTAAAVTRISNYISGVLLPMCGKINSKLFLSFSSESVLFEGASLRLAMDHTSCPAYEITLKFAVRTVTFVAGAGNDGWNYVLKIKGVNPGTWAKPMNPVTGNYLYTAVDFDPLYL